MSKTEEAVKCLPITAVIPILNCSNRLHDHLERSKSWLRMVKQIVVVDSYSTDGSLEIINQVIGHLNPVIEQHPKGLYKSWNHGVSCASEEFIYFSTVGDSITLAGLRRLLLVARCFRSDVVISPPEFISESAEVVSEKSWPIHDIIKILGLSEPTQIDPRIMYDFILVYLERAVLGSSASNLYRKNTLIKLPFSDDYYSAGDSAWMIEHNFELKVAICPELFSTYLFHEKDWDHSSQQAKIGLELRRRFAYRAFKTSLKYSPMLDSNYLTQLDRLIEESFGGDEVVACNVERLDLLTQALLGKTKATEVLLHQLRSITLRIEYMRTRAIEKKYRQSIGVFRYLSPPALANRAKKKRLIEELNGLAGKIPLHSYSS